MSSTARSIQLGLILCCSSLCACGGDDSGDSPPQGAACFETTLQNCGPGPWDPFGIALSLAWATGQCTQEVLCADEAVETRFDDGIVTDDFISENWTTVSSFEREPNDSPSEANPFVIEANSGLLVTGSVNDAADFADVIALSFGASASLNGYTVYLCRTPDDCLQPWYRGDAAYLELLDQNELVVQTSESAPEHSLTFQGSAGLMYFLAVRAARTGGVDFDYKLVITD